MKIIISISAVLFLPFFLGCGSNDRQGGIPEVTASLPLLSVPGTILLPDTGGYFELIESDYDALLLYCWLPMGQYPESENDLVFLSSVQERGIRAVPVQFISSVRNASQTQLNQLGVQLSVALGDDSLKSFMQVDILPAAMLVRSDGSVVRARGLGCAERVLRVTQ